jgi:hypothetical protein
MNWHRRLAALFALVARWEKGDIDASWLAHYGLRNRTISAFFLGPSTQDRSGDNNGRKP